MYNFNLFHEFDQSKKITNIVTTVHRDEDIICQIKFFSSEELLCTAGPNDDDWVKQQVGGRVVAFEIADDEQLIGAELYDNGNFFKGVTWLKIKIAN